MMDLSNLQSRLLSTSSSSSSFPPHRTQLHPRFLLSQTRPVKPWIWFPVAVLLTLPFIYYILTILIHKPTLTTTRPVKPSGFGIVIAAGPTGSRIHIFEFFNEGRIPFVGFDGKGSVSTKVGNVLREFEAEPERAGESMRGLLEFAKGRVPEKEWGDTKLWLVENGGLSGLRVDARRRIFESCRSVLRRSGFRFKDEWASSITGQQRGIYAWVAANYVLGTLGTNPQDTTGIIELGATSMQIVFVPNEPPPMEYSRMLKLYGTTYNLYSSSMHHFGLDAVGESLVGLHGSKTAAKPSSLIGDAVVFPCIPSGYNHTLDRSISSGGSVKKTLSINMVENFSACRSKILTYLHAQDACSHPPCRIIHKIIPELQGTPHVIEKFFYTSELFGLVPRSSLLDVEAAGRHYCEDHWSKLKDEHNSVDESDLLKYCFSTSYMLALFHDGLGIPMEDKRIGFTDPGERSPVDWTLGAFILQTMEPKFDAEGTVNIVGSDAVTYVSLATVLFLAILALTFVSKWQNPRFKTVYDLEKGRYIVTRLPR